MHLKETLSTGKIVWQYVIVFTIVESVPICMIEHNDSGRNCQRVATDEIYGQLMICQQEETESVGGAAN